MSERETSRHMAKVIEERRNALDLTPTDFQAASGLSLQQVKNVRRGELRRYQDVTINGVAKALRWERDWYERIRSGGLPAEAENGSPAGRDRIAELEATVSRQNAELDRLGAAVGELSQLVRRGLGVHVEALDADATPDGRDDDRDDPRERGSDS